MIALAVVLAVAGGIAFFYLCNSTAYYTMVDNRCITESTKAVNSGAGNFEYKLDAYDVDGNMKTITFKTSRELKEGAYLKLNAMPVRGVVNWEEVQYNNLPVAIQATYSNHD